MFLKIANNKSENPKVYLQLWQSNSQSLGANKKQKKLGIRWLVFLSHYVHALIETHKLFLVATDHHPS